MIYQKKKYYTWSFFFGPRTLHVVHGVGNEHRFGLDSGPGHPLIVEHTRVQDILLQRGGNWKRLDFWVPMPILFYFFVNLRDGI